MERSPLWVEVDLKDRGTYWFGAADEAEALIGHYIREQLAQGEEASTEALKPELAALLCRYFVEAIRDWAGVEVDSRQVAFVREDAREIDTETKIEAALFAMIERDAMLGKDSRRAEPPTCSTPPANSSAPAD
jgi:hypothetical protein